MSTMQEQTLVRCPSQVNGRAGPAAAYDNSNPIIPGTGTSYDYGAAIQENRQLAEPKYSELKLLSIFVRSAPDLAHTKVVVGASSNRYTERHDIMVTHLKNPDTRASYYIVRHKNSSCKDTTQFKLKVVTSHGKMIIPHHQDTSIEIKGRVCEKSRINYH